VAQDGVDNTAQSIPRSRSPLVTIVVPCLNRAHYLAATIDSILQQDYGGIECIVVDGGSTDDTVSILEGYGDRIKWVSEPDDGHADAINKGWRMGRGEIVSWLNADDLYVVPDCVSRVVAYMQDNPEVDVVYGDYAGISKEGNVSSEVISPREWDLEYAVKYCLPIIMQPASFIRRRILEKVGWMDENDDHYLWLRIGLAGTIRYAPIHMAYVRRDPGLSHRLYISESKVELTRKFFELPGLPYPFTTEKFRRRALSNANLVAAIGIAVGSRKIALSLRYVIRALKRDPGNFLYVMISYIGYIFFFLLPLGLQEKIRARRWPVVHGVAGRAGKKETSGVEAGSRSPE